MSWSRQGCENASYCISHTGGKPAMQRPTAVPRIPASASGVSTQRSEPKRSRRPAVARKTPPARPTSSPMTSTDGSRSSSVWKQSLIASTMLSSAIAEDPPQLLEVGAERSRRVDVRVLEEKAGIGRRLGLGLRDPAPHQLLRLRAHGLDALVVEHVQPPEVRLVAPDALVLALLLDAFEIDVRARVVGRRVRRGAVGDRLDKGRPLAGARPRHGLAGRLVHREHVSAVHAQAGHAVPDGLVGERLGPRLRLERRRDRPVVVVAEEDEWRPHHRREVGALVERALGGRAVAEVDDRARALAAQLLPPGEAGRVRHVRADRDADRGDVVVGRVPPASGMPAPSPITRRSSCSAGRTAMSGSVCRALPTPRALRFDRTWPFVLAVWLGSRAFFFAVGAIGHAYVGFAQPGGSPREPPRFLDYLAHWG